MRQRWWGQSLGPKHKDAWLLRSSRCGAPPGHLPTAAPASNVPRRRSFSSGNLQHSIGLPIVSVLDVETRCSIKLHIDDWTGKLNFVYRAWPLEQGPVILMAGGIDHGLTGRRRQRYNHRHRGCRFRNVFRHVDLDRCWLDWRIGRDFGLRNLHEGRRRLHIHGLVPCNTCKSTKFYPCEVLAKSIFQGILPPPFEQLMAIGFLDSETNRLRQEKGGLVTKSPFITHSLALRS